MTDILNITKIKAEPYKFGSDITFTPESYTGVQYQNEGWYPPSPGGSWTISGSANLSIPLAAMPASGSIKLDAAISAAYLIPGKISYQIIKVFINNTHIGEWKADTNKPNDMRFPNLVFPSKLITEPFVEISFKFPNAVYTKNKHNNINVRMGVVFWSIKMTEI